MEKKTNWQEFKKILDQHGIRKLYHFTDSANIKSIFMHGGLYSWADCESRGITIPKPGGSDTSRDLDKRDGLQNYVRISFTPEHPMMYVAEKDGRISDPIVLEIDPEVIYWEGSRYADRNATKTGANVGETIDDFKCIHFKTVKAHKYFDLNEEEKAFFQAEILVKNFIPINLISLTIESNIILSFNETTKDFANCIKDEFGAFYSTKKKCLIRVPKHIDSFTIKSGTTEIADYAFCGCNSLMNVSVPNTVSKIGNYSFYGCSRLTNIDIPDSVTMIGDFAFSECRSLKRIDIPNSVNKINRGLFSKCSCLTTMIIPDSVIEIGDQAFYNCKSLADIIIADSVTTIGKNVFEGTLWLQQQPNNSLIYAGLISYKFKGCMQTNTSIMLKEGTIGIAYNCFSSCSNLANIYLPNSVTYIGEMAFKDCTNLTNIIIPNSVRTIGSSAFKGCSNIINLVIPDSVTEIGNDAFSGCSKIQSLNINCNSAANISFFSDSRKHLKTLKFGNSITIINSEAFRGCVGLTDVIIGTSVIEIGELAFSGCTSLTNLSIPDSVRKVGSYVFFECKHLTNVYITNLTAWCSISWGFRESNPLQYAKHLYLNNNEIINLIIPDTVTKIRNYAFNHFKSLRSVFIPESVINIGESAFEGCINLICIESHYSTISIGKNAFEDTTWFYNQPNGLVYVGLVAYKYKGTMPQGTKLSIKPGTLCIADMCFSECDGLRNVTIPNTITQIGRRAFKGCYRLTSITIPSSTSFIDIEAFNGCSSIKSIKVLEGNQKYDSRDDCNAIIESSTNKLIVGCKQTFIPNTITTIGYSAFNGCDKLKRIHIPKTTILIEEKAFKFCSKLKSIKIPKSISKINDETFYGCSGLKKVQIPKSVKSIGNLAFSNCTRIKTIVIPNRVTHIGKSAFSCCTSLVNVVFEGDQNNQGFSITQIFRKKEHPKHIDIENGVFEDCTNLITVSINRPIIALTDRMFSNCSLLKSVFLHSNINIIGNQSFMKCISLEEITIPSTVSIICGFAFHDCESLKSVIIQNPDIHINQRAFEGCSTLINKQLLKYHNELSTFSSLESDLDLELTLDKLRQLYKTGPFRYDAYKYDDNDYLLHKIRESGLSAIERISNIYETINPHILIPRGTKKRFQTMLPLTLHDILTEQ